MQKLSMYICLSPVKTADFIHPKWEGCIVINSLIFVGVSEKILYCLCESSLKVWIFHGQCSPSIKDIVFVGNSFSLKVLPSHPSLQRGQRHYFWKLCYGMDLHIGSTHLKATPYLTFWKQNVIFHLLFVNKKVVFIDLW